ncbi:YdcF family protein [Nocardioides sp.]|uniref:YdcF family protein n=1 Tax=Nocardioides sp. TaxID=35761 RepID=UPI00198D66B5|nr:YdcF family protein [Nocardioides sp.]MBC7274905.1 YdcF family protein [Nocardioides sp.]
MGVLAACSGVLVWGGLLLWSLKRDPRSLRNGFLLLVFVHYLLGLLVYVASTSTMLATAMGIVTLVVGLVIALGLLALPLLLVADGILMMRRERRSLANTLALLTGLAMLLLPIVLVALLRHENPVTSSVAVALLTAQVCAGACFLAFVAHTALYAQIARRASAHAVIVLGSGLVRGGVSPLLAARLEYAVDAATQREGPDGMPVIVPSGGQGPDEPRPEGQAMRDWLRQRGVAADDILVEDRARTTRENLLYSAQLLERHGQPTPYLIVTNNYHAPRAAMLARRLGIDAQAIGARTAWYYWPSAYLREFVAVMVEHRALIGLAAAAVVVMTVLTWLSLATR